MLRTPLGSPAASAAAERPWHNPRNLIIAGSAVNILAAVLAMAVADDTLVPLRVGLILTGLTLALVAVNLRLRYFGEDIEERGTTAAYLAMGSFVTLLAYLGTSEQWDSFRLLLGVFVAVGLIGAVLVLLPQVARRCVIVVLVLFHFGGILTAVFSPAPPGGVGCWMTNALWTYIYRPYLQFMYMNNAYHFYSPEPGPSTQLWFYVTYEDPKVPPRWVQFPRREDFNSRLSYQRSLAMTESTVQGRPNYPNDFFLPKGRVWRRMEERSRIPYHPKMQVDQGPFAAPDLSQYGEPADLSSKKYVASYARHVARDPKYRDPDHPDVAVKSVKVYRVLHLILQPAELAAGSGPEDPTKLRPVYMGEFDADATLLDAGDPMLYWVVPIYADHNADGDIVIKSSIATHAGSDPPFLTKLIEEAEESYRRDARERASQK